MAQGKVLYGIKRAVMTPLNPLTQLPTEDGAIVFKTAEEAGIEKVVSEGAEEIKRVDNEILAVVTTEDIGYGYNITLVDNVFQLDMAAMLEGGTVRYDETETTKIVGYDDPMMSNGASVAPFQLELYVAVYEGTDIVEYAKITFPNCKGRINKLDVKKEFTSPEFTIKAREATRAKKPARSIDFVATSTLPALT